MHKVNNFLRLFPFLSGFASILWAYFKTMKKEIKTKAFVLFFLQSALLLAIPNIFRIISLGLIQQFSDDIWEWLLFALYIILGYLYNEIVLKKAKKLVSKQNIIIRYAYNHSGRLIYEINTKTYYQEGSGVVGMAYIKNNVTSAYYFQKNLMGDVVAIYNTSGVKVASYAYDSWGNCTASGSMAPITPIRYRGYYYDEDTKLYYLNARYYSPEFRCFISPDNTDYLDPENVNPPAWRVDFLLFVQNNSKGAAHIVIIVNRDLATFKVDDLFYKCKSQAVSRLLV